MKITDVIVKYGTEAVQLYSTIAGNVPENEMPEIFLGSYIASGIHKEQRLNAHVERSYTIIAKEIGILLSTEVLGKFRDGKQMLWLPRTINHAR